MDQHQLLQDREHVWLRTSERRGEYLHADDDGVGVSVQESRTSLNAAWAVHVHHSQRHGRCVLLHSAAYGRYLAATPTPAPLGHRGFRVVQSNYDQPETGDRGHHVEGRPGRLWERHPAPQRHRTLPPRQREDPPLEQGRHRRRHRDHHDALGRGAHPRQASPSGSRQAANALRHSNVDVAE